LRVGGLISVPAKRIAGDPSNCNSRVTVLVTIKA
jgi:hypothetical protein